MNPLSVIAFSTLLGASVMLVRFMFEFSKWRHGVAERKKIVDNINRPTRGR